MRVVFSEQLSLELVERYGKVKEMNGQEVLLEVDPDDASRVASHLFSTFPIKDITITDPPLEDVIESIYQGAVLGGMEHGA
jgi:ABC-2 type transport system ATP-binding protein